MHTLHCSLKAGEAAVGKESICFRHDQTGCSCGALNLETATLSECGLSTCMDLFFGPFYPHLFERTGKGPPPALIHHSSLIAPSASSVRVRDTQQSGRCSIFIYKDIRYIYQEYIFKQSTRLMLFKSELGGASSLAPLHTPTSGLENPMLSGKAADDRPPPLEEALPSEGC